MLANDSNISLFPLNVVLFPGMILPLHIFEDRYKAMIRECLASDHSFGVVLAKTSQAQTPNVADLNRNDIHVVGTTARITAVENLEDGCMNLVTVGQDRFVVKDVHPSKDDFLIGQVDPFPIEEAETDTLNLDDLNRKLRKIVKRYIGHLGDATGEELSDAVLPADPISLAYLAGAALQGPMLNKQKLLSARSVGILLKSTINILDREDQILVYMLRAYHTHLQAQRLPFVDYCLN